jgi:hypothetical protein
MILIGASPCVIQEDRPSYVIEVGDIGSVQASISRKFLQRQSEDLPAEIETERKTERDGKKPRIEEG